MRLTRGRPGKHAAANTTPACGRCCSLRLATANSLKRAEATAPLRGSALARIRLSSTFRPARLAAPLCVGSPASLPRPQRRHTGAPAARSAACAVSCTSGPFRHAVRTRQIHTEGRCVNCDRALSEWQGSGLVSPGSPANFVGRGHGRRGRDNMKLRDDAFWI